MPQAVLVFRAKEIFSSGWILEITVWRLPALEPERPHGFKYSLFFGKEGRRVVGYHNERGKGDHRHIEDREEAYVFTTLEALLSDFFRDVDATGLIR